MMISTFFQKTCSSHSLAPSGSIFPSTTSRANSASKRRTTEVIEYIFHLAHSHLEHAVLCLCAADGRSQIVAVRSPLFDVLLQQFQIPPPDPPLLFSQCFGSILFPKVKVLNELGTLIQIALALPLHVLHDAERSLHALVQALQ